MLDINAENTTVLYVVSGFLANVNSRSLYYAVARPSVVCLSVTFVRPSQPVKIFGNISTPFGILTIHWYPPKILWRLSQETLRRGGGGKT